MRRRRATAPARRAVAPPGPSWARREFLAGQPLPGQRQQPPLVGEGHRLRSLPGLEPASLRHLVVVPGEVAAGRQHEVVVHELVVPGLLRGPHEPVVDRIERREDAGVQTGLLADLAQRGLLQALALLLLALGEGPLVRPRGRDAGDQDDRRGRRGLGQDEPAGGDRTCRAHYVLVTGNTRASVVFTRSVPRTLRMTPASPAAVYTTSCPARRGSMTTSARHSRATGGTVLSR